MKITVESRVDASVDRVWDTWNDPDDIRQWNAAQDTRVEPRRLIEYRMEDGLGVRIEFEEDAAGGRDGPRFRPIGDRSRQPS